MLERRKTRWLESWIDYNRFRPTKWDRIPPNEPHISERFQWLAKAKLGGFGEVWGGEPMYARISNNEAWHETRSDYNECGQNPVGSAPPDAPQ